MIRRTKIIATLGPASESSEVLTELIQAGVSIFRLNMSHARHEWVREIVAKIRNMSDHLHARIGFMMDTQGPEIRTGELSNNLPLKPGDIFTFTVRGAMSPEVHSVDVNYDNLVNDIQVGDTVLVDSGVIRMKVLSKETNQLRCEVLTPGTMTSRRHINLPGIRVNLPALTPKDIQDVKLACELGLQFIALSFVREAADIQMLRDLLIKEAPHHTFHLIAKIEDQQAVQNLDEIIAIADAIMVARGDLGIECPYEELPIIQRRIVKKCLHATKPVIVATHMLESMITNPIPTRAEITDVANAVYEQADAIMLSGETSVGHYPVACVQVMDRIARRIEQSGGAGFAEAVTLSESRDSVVASGVHLANNLRADALLVFTRRGHLASLAAALRPRYSPIFAFTPDSDLAARLTLRRAISAFVLPFSDNREDTVTAALHHLSSLQLLKSGAKVVVVTDLTTADQIVDSIQVRMVK